MNLLVFAIKRIIYLKLELPKDSIITQQIIRQSVEQKTTKTFGGDSNFKMFEILLKKNLPEKQRFPVKKRLGSIHEIKKGSDML